MIFSRNLILATALAACAQPALSLSCLPPDVARTFKTASEVEDLYVIVHGVLSFDEKRVPKEDFDNQENTPPDTFVPATLKGRSLGLDGYSQSFDQDITLNVRCFGPWCGGARSGIEYLAFLKKDDDGYLLELDPCGGMGFGQPTKEMLDTSALCMRGNICKEKAF
ncbi:hypothetical protein [Roseovarius sp. EL26]|uniref:hypothetical protein n=1 Tax=Roseovarius sp. EL26 TaxID=2126672 RepID=UPI000EA1EA93|nr:hypothetical protein [Roseovarius sp. EL26]